VHVVQSVKAIKTDSGIAYQSFMNELRVLDSAIGTGHGQLTATVARDCKITDEELLNAWKL